MTLPHALIETGFALALVISVAVIVRDALRNGSRIINALSFPHSPATCPPAGEDAPSDALHPCIAAQPIPTAVEAAGDEERVA